MRSVAILVLLVIILAAITAWALLPRSGAPTANTPFDPVLAALSPESLRAIDITQPQGPSSTPSPTSSPASSPAPRTTRIHLDPATRQWLIRDAATSWPVVSSRPRALAALLADVGKGSRERSSQPDASTRLLRLEFASTNTPTASSAAPSVHEIHVDATALAGRTRIFTRDESGQWWTALADAPFAALFTPESLRAWIEPGALVDVGQTASHIRLESADGLIELSRQGPRWSITTPALGLADTESVSLLLQQLAEFTLPYLMVPPANPTSTHSNSVFFATITSDLAAANAPLVQTIRVRQNAITPDSVEGEAFAAFEDAAASSSNPPLAWGPVAVRLDRAKFDAIRADPLRYVSRIATQTPRADIAIIRVTRDAHAMDLAYQLTPLSLADASNARALTLSTLGTTWRVTPPISMPAASMPPADATPTSDPASRGVPATPEQERWIAQLRDLLTTTRAETVSMSRDLKPRGELILTLATPGGAPLDVLAIGLSTAKGAPRVVVRRANVLLMYDAPNGTSLVEWLERQLPPEG